MIRRFVDSFYLDVVALVVLFIVGIGYLVTMAFGQANNSNTWQTPGNQTVGGMVIMTPNTAGLAVPSGNNLAPGTSITATGAGTTAATTATLAAAAGKTTFICGFSITATATAGLASTATVATVVGGNTLTFGQSVGTAPAVASTLQNFNPCIPANAVNTGITVTSAAAGTAGVTNVSAWGFQF